MMIKPSQLAVLATSLIFAMSTARAHDQPETKKSGDNKFSAGLTFNDTATADDAGLPLYPGAIPHRNKKHDGDGVNLAFWGGSFGLKVVVVELDSSDSVEKVAAFYQRALSQYGDVLDCSKPVTDAEGRNRRDKSRPLSCERDHAKKKGLVYKAGTREKQRIVSVQPQGQGSVFQLVYVEKRGAD